MRKKMRYSKYSLGQRFLFFVAGLLNPLIGFVLYFLHVDDKEDDWKCEFLYRGSLFGIIFMIIGVVLYVVSVTGSLLVK